MGVDPWQPARISDAFSAAEAFNANLSSTCATQNVHTFVDDVDSIGASSSFSTTGPRTANNCTAKPFKLAISFDMSSFPCANSNDASNLRSIATAHSSSPAQLQICTADGNGGMSLQPVLSTFAGEACGFGQGGWQSVTSGFWFAPAFFDMSKGWTGWSGVQASLNVRIRCLCFRLITILRELTMLCSGMAGGPRGTTIFRSLMIRLGSRRRMERDMSPRLRLGSTRYAFPSHTPYFHSPIGALTLSHSC